MTDIATDLIQSFFRRWSNLEDQKAELAADARDLMAEIKGQGFSTKAVRAAFRRKRDASERAAEIEAFEAEVETILAALNAPSRAHPRDAHVSEAA